MDFKLSLGMLSSSKIISNHQLSKILNTARLSGSALQQHSHGNATGQGLLEGLPHHGEGVARQFFRKSTLQHSFYMVNGLKNRNLNFLINSLIKILFGGLQNRVFDPDLIWGNFNRFMSVVGIVKWFEVTIKGMLSYLLPKFEDLTPTSLGSGAIQKEI